MDQLVDKYNISSPFLDIGCGNGDVSQHFASKGWSGKAIDSSEAAIKEAKLNLASFSNIRVEKESLSQEKEVFKTIFLIDVLEHIEDDETVLKNIFTLLSSSGYLIIVVPSNPKEWSWDDDFYGHYRRYSVEEIRKKMINAGFKPLIIWDITYPFFWFMRRIYTRLKIYTRFRFFSRHSQEDRAVRTASSSLVNAWDIPIFSKLLSRKFIFWRFLYKIQFTYFKDKVNKGHETIILAKKKY